MSAEDNKNTVINYQMAVGTLLQTGEGKDFEEYLADNWAVDGLAPYDPSVVQNTLLLGQKTMDYEVRVFTVSASYRFQ